MKLILVRYAKSEKRDSLIKTYKHPGRFYKIMLRKYPKKNILLISYGIFLLCLILNSLNLPVTETKYFSLSNAEVSTFNINDKTKTVVKYHINDYHHLIQGRFKNH